MKSDPNKELIDLLENFTDVLMSWEEGVNELNDGTATRTYINRNPRAVQ